MSQSRESGAVSRKLRIDNWLKRHLQDGDLHGLQWIGSPAEGVFSISWSHKSAHSWNMAKQQNNIFLAYSLASRCSRGSNRQMDYRQLKQNLRCAMRGSRHLEFVPALSQSRGSDACRAYRFLAEPRSGANSMDDGSPDLSPSDFSGSLSPFDFSSLEEPLPCLDVDFDLDILAEPSRDSSRGGDFPMPSPSQRDPLDQDLKLPDEDLFPVSFDEVLTPDDKDMLDELFTK